MEEAYQMLQDAQAYLECVQQYVTEKVIEQNAVVEEYLKDLQKYVAKELVTQNEILREKLVELKEKTDQLEECLAEMLQKQLEELRVKSIEVMNCTKALAKATSIKIAKNVAEAMDKMAELQEMATIVLAEYQKCFAEMSKAVQEQLREQLVEAMAAFEQAAQQFQEAVECINKAIAAAKAGNVQKMMELLDMIKNFDYKGVVEDYIKDLLNNADVQKIIEELLKLESKMEDTAGDIIAYGNALVEQGLGSTPYTDGLVSQAEVKELESMNSQLKTMINTLNQDVAALTKANEDLQKIVQKGDDEYRKLVANVKNAKRVSKNKTTLKKATKSTKSKQITIKWAKWDETNNGKITQYQVYYKAQGSKAVKKYVSKNKTKYVAKKLKKGKTYTVKVRAIYKLPYKNAAGETKHLIYLSKWSKSKKVTVK
jgi:hypothetical protein